VPAYLADVFGTQFVGAIHGRLLTAWSAAGIIGPFLVTNYREYKIAQGVPRDYVYDQTMYILAGLLVVGLICNLLIRPLADKWFMKPEEVAALQAGRGSTTAASGSFGIGKGGFDLPAAAFWLFVGIPLAWGVYKTLISAVKIF
jgi:hypothetical protein